MRKRFLRNAFVNSFHDLTEKQHNETKRNEPNLEQANAKEKFRGVLIKLEGNFFTLLVAIFFHQFDGFSTSSTRWFPSKRLIKVCSKQIVYFFIYQGNFSLMQVVKDPLQVVINVRVDAREAGHALTAIRVSRHDQSHLDASEASI